MPPLISQASRDGRASRVNPRLLLLALAAFTLSMDAFVMIGMVPVIAREMRVTEGMTGQLITAFSLTYALIGPGLAALAARFPRNRVLIMALAAFCLTNLGATLAPTFAFLFVMRIVSGASSALYVPLAYAIGFSLAPPEKRGQALSLIMGGSTVALVLGGPLGTWIGEQWGWRLSFGLVAAASGITCLVLWLVHLPQLAETPVLSRAAKWAPVREPRLILAFFPAFLWIVGFYIVYTYLAPLLEDQMHVTDVSGLLLVFGLGTVAGNWLGGKLADRFGTVRLILVSLMLLIAILALFSWMTAELLGMLPALFLLGMAMPSLSIAQQHRMLSLAPAHAPVISSFNSSIMYLGSALGAALGGTLLPAVPVTRLGWIGAGWTLLALFVFLVSASVSKPVRDTSKKVAEG